MFAELIAQIMLMIGSAQQNNIPVNHTKINVPYRTPIVCKMGPCPATARGRK